MITEHLDHLPIYAPARAYENWSYSEDDDLMPNKPTPTQRLDEVDIRLESLDRAVGIRTQPNEIGWAGRFFAKYPMAPVLGTAAIAVTIICTLATIFIPRWLEQRSISATSAVQLQIDTTLSKPGGVQETLEGDQIHYRQNKRNISCLATLYSGAISASTGRRF